MSCRKCTLRELTLFGYEAVSYTSLPNTLEILRLQAPMTRPDQAENKNNQVQSTYRFRDPERWFTLTDYPRLHTLYLQAQDLPLSLFATIAKQCPVLKVLYLSDLSFLNPQQEYHKIIYLAPATEDHPSYLAVHPPSLVFPNRPTKRRYRKLRRNVQGLATLVQNGCLITPFQTL